MHTSQNSASTIRTWAAIVSLFITTFSSAWAATWNFTANLIPAEGGTITPLGEYPDGTSIKVVVAANPGWFISGFGAVHSPKDGLDAVALGFLGNRETPGVFQTNIETSTVLKSDLLVTANFQKMVPVFVDPFSDVTEIRNFSIYSDVEGLWPLHYEWSKDGVPIPGQSGVFARGVRHSELYFENVDPSMSGTYSLTVTNGYGSATTSAQVTVPAILASIPDLFYGTPILTNHVLFTNSFVFDLLTPYQGAHIYYTLDGKGPTFASSEFQQSITIYSDTTLRAVVYTSDFSKSAYLDPIEFEKASTVNLHYILNGLGTIEGKVSTALKGSSVSLNAVPIPGSFFVSWEIPQFKDNPEITIQVDQDIVAVATFAAPVSVNTAGGGTVDVEPDSPGYVPGTQLLLYPKPALGSYFVRWNDPTSTAVPFQLQAGIDFPPTALFAPLPSGQVSLTAISRGPGSVSGITTKVFPVGSSVSLEAEPFQGKRFLRWSGDAAGTNASIALSLTASMVVYAEFESLPSVAVDTYSHVIFANNSSGIGSVIDFFSSSNLQDWHQDSSKTNFSGFAFESFSPTNSAQFFKAVQRNR